jgi:hypothetical protein
MIGLGEQRRFGEELAFGSCEKYLWFPKIPSGADSRDEAESAHHPARCLHSFSCLGRWSPTCSSRGAGFKSRTSFSGISSILL